MKMKFYSTFILYLLVPLSTGFLDYKFPIIITNIADGNESYFGATVSLTQYSNSSWLIVGAPKANSTANPSVNSPGVVWWCSIGRERDSCNIFPIDPTGSSANDRKDEGFLGGSLAIKESGSGSDNIVTCASRWINGTYGDAYAMNGACYVNTRDKAFKNDPWSKKIPLDAGNRNAQGWHGQAGFSLHIPSKIENEVVIGAPGTIGWTGTVLKYFSERLNQRIVLDSKLFPPNMKMEKSSYFGYSVTTGKFVQSKPIMYVAYGSEQTVIIRSRQIVNVTGRIWTSVHILQLNATEFEIDSCITYDSSFKQPKLTFIVRIEVDIQARPRRVYLKLPDQQEGSATYEEEALQNTESCTNFKAIVSQSVPLESSGSPVVILQHIELKDDVTSDDKVKTTNYIIKRRLGVPFLDVQGQSYKSFCSTCPVISLDSRMDTDWKIPLAVPCGSDGICTSHLVINATFKELESQNSFVIGSAMSLALQISVTNFGETAISPSVTVSWIHLKLIKYPSGCKRIEDGQKQSYKCSLGKLLSKDETSSLILEMDMSDLTANDQSLPDDIAFNIEAETVSEVLEPAVFTIMLPLESQADVDIIGSSSEVIFNPKTLANITRFEQSFEVALQGPSSVANVLLHFKIPVNVTTPSGKQAIIEVYDLQDQTEYFCEAIKGSFTHAASFSGSDEHTPEFDAVIDAGMFSSRPRNSKPRRRREAKEDEHIDEISKTRPQRLVEKDQITLHCDSGLVSCLEVKCKVHVFKADTSIAFRFMMGIASSNLRKLLRELKSKSLKIESDGDVRLLRVNNHQDIPKKAEAITLIKLEQPTEVASWVYWVSILGGLLLLGCIVFCLYGCGCFQRKKKPGEGEEGTEEEKQELQKEEESEERQSPEVGTQGTQNIDDEENQP